MKPEMLRIGTPCSLDWDAMEGCGSRRFCGSCKKTVTDLSQLTERQARTVVSQPEVCVRYAVDTRGDVRFRRSVGARLLALGAALLPSAAIAGGAANTAERPSLVTRIAEAVGLVEPQIEHHLMGDVAVLQPPAQVQFVNTTTRAVSVTCDGVAVEMQPGIPSTLTVHEYSSCAMITPTTDGSRTDTLGWVDHGRSCELRADALVCEKR
jgi:hypothetical protein